MAKDTKFKRGRSGNPQTRFKPGNRFRWQPGQSGNPDGIPRSRLQFEERFYAALLDQGGAEEVASLLWKAARQREPWAIQAMLQRLAPESKQIKVTHGVEDDSPIDYTRLSKEELDEIERMLHKATVPTEPSEEGAGTPKPKGIRDPGVARTGTKH